MRLHPEAARVLRQVDAAGKPASPRAGDHSNTQFAVMGMWCARRHGFPVDGALEKLEEHYRACQSTYGGWGYILGEGYTASMTCAGLIGLSTALQPKKDEPADPAVERGLAVLGKYISESKGAGAPKLGRGKFKIDNLARDQYFLWSLERVGMAYGVETIGGHDWFSWGAQVLIETQDANGSWKTGKYLGASPETNTAMALLFLCRANLAEEMPSTGSTGDKDARLRGGLPAPMPRLVTPEKRQ